MKLPKFALRKKLRASTSARRFGDPEEMDEMSEPNMKLSRALLIVLLLHVVAVAGIIAFNTIKSRQGAFPATKPTATPAAVAASPIVSVKTEVVSAISSAKEEPKIPKALPVTKDAGNFYVVAKGDNPVKIAKKLKVSESELLAVNHIDDPRKLQIGQKLIVPSSKAAKGKKSNE